MIGGASHEGCPGSRPRYQDRAVVRPHHSLGVIAAQEGRRDEAAARWHEAIRLNHLGIGCPPTFLPPR